MCYIGCIVLMLAKIITLYGIVSWAINFIALKRDHGMHTTTTSTTATLGESG